MNTARGGSLTPTTSPSRLRLTMRSRSDAVSAVSTIRVGAHIRVIAMINWPKHCRLSLLDRGETDLLRVADHGPEQWPRFRVQPERHEQDLYAVHADLRSFSSFPPPHWAHHGHKEEGIEDAELQHPSLRAFSGRVRWSRRTGGLSLIRVDVIGFAASIVSSACPREPAHVETRRRPLTMRARR